jgi:hypothetical protein
MAKIIKPVETQSGVPLGDTMKTFLDVAMKVAHIDEAIMKARASAPSQEDSEAFKWHEVSIKALMWTRSSLVEQQGSALGQLKSSVESQQLSAFPFEKPMPQLSAQAKPFSPTAAKPKAETQDKSPKALTPAQVGAKVAAGDMTVGSLRDDLERLKDYDAQQCLIVRRIKRLGLGSPEILRDHFSGFGGVKEMLISHSFEKKSAKCRADRVRPAALGFIIMDSVDAAQAALKAGPTLMISGVDVEVKVFEPLDVLQQKESFDAKANGLKSFQ